MSETINILIVDDHEIFRDGLKFVISSIENLNVIGEARNGVDFLNLIDVFTPDVVLMDISMPEMNGIDASINALQKYPKLKIISLSSYGDEVYYYKMIKAGVLGFVQKKSGKEELEKAIRTVYGGSNYFPQHILRNLIFKIGNDGEDSITTHDLKLSSREKEVLIHICQGYSNVEIADKLCISPKTVDNHRTNLLSKTAAKNSAHLVMFAIKNKLIEI